MPLPNSNAAFPVSFGIGFKSVYAFTDRPEVHSGHEDFAIESFVWPVAAPAMVRNADETVVVLPLREPVADHAEIVNALQGLGAGTLLFLRDVEAIEWSVESGPSGLYLRSEPEMLEGQWVRRVEVVGQQKDGQDIEQTWLVFSRTVEKDGGVVAGQAEIAFSLVKSPDSERATIRPVQGSPLVVFFPTVKETSLGFLVQGPYRTTPSRDNVPAGDSWNRSLIALTAQLLAAALAWLRDNGLLDTAALLSLPIDSSKFGDGAMFGPLFSSTKSTLLEQSLLPRFDGGYAPARRVRLGRSEELRSLLSPRQLADLFGSTEELAWLSGDITQDRTPELRQYLVRELGIAEVTPESVVPKLTEAFLQKQDDEWVVRLYEFLNGQPALLARLAEAPVVRLANGTQVRAVVRGQPQGFLPGEIETGFPLVCRSVCKTKESRAFLTSLGLTEPDPVDDVIRNILPRYATDEPAVAASDYDADVARILKASATDSKTQRDKLVAGLRESPFVCAVDLGDGTKRFAKPLELYIATERLKELFDGVVGVLMVDDAVSSLRGEQIRDLLDTCGASRYLQPTPVSTTLGHEERQEMRTAAGNSNVSSGESIRDNSLRGLDALLALMPTIESPSRERRASVLWEALSDLAERRGKSVFLGEYSWFYYNRSVAAFPAAFVRKLGSAPWVPAADGELETPGFVVFDSLGWKVDPVLASVIRFKPPLIEELAKEAGIEPGVLDLLRKLGVTSVAELRSKLQMDAEEPEGSTSGTATQSASDAVAQILGNGVQPTPPETDTGEDGPIRVGGSEGGVAGRQGGSSTESGHQHGGGTNRSDGDGSSRRGSSKGGERTFISYVATSPHEETPDPDGLDQSARLALEEKAIEFILQEEPQLQRTKMNNEGFDLLDLGPDAEIRKWVEVKAMAGDLDNRPVGLSRAQFKCAQEHKDAYWLYIVEHAASGEARLIRISDPAGKTRTFSFDRGWRAIAEINDAATGSIANGEN